MIFGKFAALAAGRALNDVCQRPDGSRVIDGIVGAGAGSLHGIVCTQRHLFEETAMEYRFIALLGALAMNQSVLAADATQSPYDTNPACLDRNIDSSKGDCVITYDGTPRHKYPPKRTTTTPVAPATSSPQTASPGARKSS